MKMLGIHGDPDVIAFFQQAGQPCFDAFAVGGFQAHFIFASEIG